MMNIDRIVSELHEDARRAGGSLASEPLFDTDLDLKLVDIVDGRVILNSALSVRQRNRRFSSIALPRESGLTLEVTQGQATVQRDPFSENLIVTPKGTTPVKVRPVLEGRFENEAITFVGLEEEVGIDIRNILEPQRHFDRGGGGACRGNLKFEPGSDFDFDLRVRAFMPSNVIPLSLDRRRIHWRNALYFAHNQQIGNMRIRYNEQFQSVTNLLSKTPQSKATPENFFPASGANELFFIIEFLDLGLSCFNKEPMVQSYDQTDWPPYSTVLSIDEPVQFYNMESPEDILLTISKNDMNLYDYMSAEVECLSSNIDADGMLRSRWRIVNQAREAVRARWFALGDFVPRPELPDQGSRLLSPAGTQGDSFEIDFTAVLRKSILSQKIHMNIVSLNDPVVMGSNSISFRFPRV